MACWLTDLSSRRTDDLRFLPYSHGCFDEDMSVSFQSQIEFQLNHPKLFNRPQRFTVVLNSTCQTEEKRFQFRRRIK